ncbi:glyoxalase I [Monosporozyma unispora]|nr:Lactoylglutathione lyase [Kazachstania unispora]
MSFENVIEVAQNDQSLKFNHTCLRIKDPKVSVPFYEEKFGMKLLSRKDFPEMNFSLYFLTFADNKTIPDDSNGKPNPFAIQGTLELTHNWGSEIDATFEINNGNVEPHRGYGHVGFATNDIVAECNKLESLGVEFKKKLSDGRQKDIAFVLDPDGYWIELVEYKKETKLTGYQFNHTMIRIKDPEKSVKFYENVLGMHTILKSEHANAKFTNYFMGYYKQVEDRLAIEGVLELTHNWGTENDPEFHYHNGNDKPQGYGHICVSLKDPSTLCQAIEETYGDAIPWAPKWNQGKIKSLAFLKDPDGYSIEVVPDNLTL